MGAEARGKRIDRAIWRRAIVARRVEAIWDDDRLELAATASEPSVEIVGFEFDRREIERVAREHGAGVNSSKPTKVRGGRPSASWWSAFAEELAVYVHDNGIPDGSGSEGQGELIDAVCDAMSERGVDETPSRRSVQPVVQAVLDRIRSAGN